VLRGQTLVSRSGTLSCTLNRSTSKPPRRACELKKVVLAIGNTLIYRDTYEQALGDLSALMQAGVCGRRKEPLAAAAVRAAPVSLCSTA